MVFSANLQRISAHNKLYDEGKVSYKLGVNAFSDLTQSEFKVRFKSLKYADDVVIVDYEQYEAPSDVELPEVVDWRNDGAVTRVQNQGACGSCWAFSATGSLEAQYYFKTGKLVSLSEKNLVDCSKESIKAGCTGGAMVRAFQFIHNNDEVEDPYKPVDGRCKHDDTNNYTVVEVVLAKLGNEEALKAILALHGPVAVAIDASQYSFQMYSEGVYYEPQCISAEEDPLGLLDHGVLVVGYGTEDDQEYWLVKNSWGDDWGEAGYIKMSRNKGNNCGIASYAILPVIYY